MLLGKLVAGRLLRRYRRFLADVQLDDGALVTAHTANTGRMLGCSLPGSRVWLSRSDNPRRKHAYTWELVEVDEGVLVGINTARANALVAEAVVEGRIEELRGYTSIRREVSYGLEGSRVDLLLEEAGRVPCHVEVKNVTLAEAGVAYFPDAVTARGLKHLRELSTLASRGGRAVIFFCIQRADVTELRPARSIDPAYADMLQQAVACGVEALAYAAQVGVEAISLHRALPVVLSAP